MSARILVAVAVLLVSVGCSSSGPQHTPDEPEPLTQPAATAEANESSEESESATAASEDSEQPETDQASDEDDFDDLPLYAVGPVAVIDGEEITADSFNSLITQRTKGMGANMPPHLVQRFKVQAVDQLIDERLVNQQMATVDIDVDAEEVEQEWVAFKERFPTEEALESFMSRQGLDAAQFKKRLEKELMLRKYLEDKYGVEVTEDDARQFYSKNSVRFEQKEQVRARHILIKVDSAADPDTLQDARQRAGEVAAEAKEPDADFAALAREYSEGPTAQRGGDLGFFTRRRMVSEFSDAAFDMQPGEISVPVKTQFGYHVIKVEERKEAGTIPFEEAKEGIVDQLLQQDRRRAMKALLAELKDGTDIERHEDNIESNVDTSTQGQPQSTGDLPPELKKKLHEQVKRQQLKQQNAEGVE